jgi:uncharacterized membrane protein
MSSSAVIQAVGTVLVCLFALDGAQAGKGEAIKPAQFATNIEAALPKFCLHDLGLLPDGEAIYPTALNEHGDVVGNSVNGKAFLYQDGWLRLIEPLAGSEMVAVSAINNFRVVVGNSVKTGTDAHNIPLSYDNGRSTPLAGLTDAIPYAINDRGEIVGASREMGAFLYQQGSISVLGKPGSVAYAINNNGDVAGVMDDGTAFAWRGGVVQMLGIPGSYAHSEAMDINDHGTVVGFSSQSDITDAVAFIYTKEKGIKNLGRFVESDRYSIAMSINNSGVVVGYSGISEDFFATIGLRALIYQDNATLDLNTLVELPPGVTLTAAVAINERGQVAARGARDQTLHGFLLTPRRDGEKCDGSGDRRP